MTAFDYALLLLLIGSVVISLMRGLIREVLSLISWVVAFFVANAYGERVVPLLTGFISEHTVRVMVAFIALFIGARIVMMFLMRVVDILIKASGLTIIDRALGGLFGLGRGIVIALFLVILCGMTAIPQQPFWKNARFSPMAETFTLALLPYLPGHLEQYVKY